MTDHAVRRRTGRIRALLALGVVVGLGSMTTGAYWTDDATVTGITLSSGKLDLKVDNQDNVTGYTSLNLTNMIPGHSVAAVLTISNAGNVPFTYTATSSATNPDSKGLAAALTVKVTGATTVTGSSPTATCGGTTLAGTGAVLNGGLVTTARPVAAGGLERLCLQITLPTTATNAVQDATTGVTLAFNATQVGP